MFVLILTSRLVLFDNFFFSTISGTVSVVYCWILVIIFQNEGVFEKMFDRKKTLWMFDRKKNFVNESCCEL